MKVDNYENELKVINNMYHTFRLILIASIKLQKFADSLLNGITLRQHMLLVAIATSKSEEINIVNIAKILGTSKQNVTRLVNNMIKSGYLTSIQRSDDKRSLNISLTEKGLNACQSNYEKFNQYLLDVFKDFSAEELETFYNTFFKIVSFNEEEIKIFKDSLEIKLGCNPDYDELAFLKVLRNSHILANK